MSKVCPACLGREFSFKDGPCALCNQPILGFKILISEAPEDRLRFDNEDLDRESILRGIADVLAETMLEVGKAVERPF